MKKSIIALVACASSLLISTSVLAETKAKGDRPISLFDMPLAEVLEMDVSTASKLTSRADLAPGNLTVVTQDQIRRYGYRTVGEALERVVGFQQSDLGFTSTVAFRGLTPQGFTSNARILFLIDGLRYNERAYDTALVNETFPLDIESIDRIEVLKGAGSAVWGTNAMYAVVNVISKDAASAKNKKIMGEVASHSRRKGYASYGDESESGFKYFTSVSATKLDGSISAFYPALNDPSTANGIADGPYEREAYRTSARIAYEGFYTNFLHSADTTDINSDVDFRLGDGGSSDFRQEPTRVEAGYKLNLWEEQKAELLLRAYYSNDYYRGLFTFPSGDEIGSTSYDRYRNQLRTRGAELRYSQNILENVKGLAGVELSRVYQARFTNEFQQIDPTGDLVPDSTSGYVQNLPQSTSSYFFDVMYAPIEEMNIFLGGRFEKPSDLSTAFGPRASVVVNPVKGTIFKLLYSQGFRNPNLGESFIYQPAPQRLDPEKLNFYEFLVEQRFEDWLSVTASVFYNDLKDSLGEAFVEDGNIYYTNYKGFTSKGVELEARARLEKGMQGYAHFTHTDARNKDTLTDLENTPAYLARLGLSFDVGEVFSVSPEIMYGSSTRTDDGNYFDSYVIANLTLASFPIARGGTLAGTVYNVFDSDYVRYYGGSGADSKAMEAGREFRMQATWEFERHAST